MKINNPSVNTTKKILISLTMAAVLTLTAAAPAVSEEAWRASFDDLCSKVDASGSLTIQELTVLVERVDKLVPQIQASTDPSKKIYLQRIKKCRSLFEFMIESKKGAAQ